MWWAVGSDGAGGDGMLPSVQKQIVMAGDNNELFNTLTFSTHFLFTLAIILNEFLLFVLEKNINHKVLLKTHVMENTKCHNLVVFCICMAM